MAFRLSNNLIGILNAVTFLLSVPVLGAGIWLGTRADGTECERYLSAPVIALGVFLMLVSVAGLVGACCRVNCLLWFYLVAMFVLIVVVLCFTVFAFAVTNKGAGEAVSGKGYKEYKLGDYSNWLRKRVENSKNWNRIRSCLQDSKVCKTLQQEKWTQDQFFKASLSPLESGCCKPPTSCGFTYIGGTNWTTTTTTPASTDPDCATWKNDDRALCYDCQSCKAGVVATLKRDWKRVAVVCIVFLVFIVIVYSVGCCAFRNNRRDNHRGAYRGAGGAGWKGGYA
ncbi:tetraspanin-8-like [Oryza brachyantha]|uniref:tetraspanin-8-like n=1 Tax=Oryza brachyantha TaxID=4533 RepID=UPI0007767623|nr:tetraspanin-8-like [Oryza brachyantha]